MSEIVENNSTDNIDKDENPNNTEKYGMSFIVSTLLGIVLFNMIGKYAMIPTGTSGIYIYLQYIILVYLAGKYGPLSGGLIGFLGHAMLEKSSPDPIWWSWVIGSSLLGISIGFLSEKFKVDFSNPEGKDRRKFSLINCGCQIIVWCIIVPLLSIIMKYAPASESFHDGCLAGINNLLTSVIVCDLILFSRKNVIAKKIIAALAIINSLILLSYGNFGFGSIVVYTITIILSASVFINFKHDTSKYSKAKKTIQIACIAIVSIFMGFFIFLHINAILDKPAGDEACMIILGDELNGEEPSKILHNRLDTAYEYIRLHPNITVITSGFQNPGDSISEGELMRNYLIEKGCNEKKIIAETKAANIDENFKNSLECMKELGMDEKTCTIFVTNDFNCFRSRKYAKAHGFTDIHPLSASTPVPSLLSSYFSEAFALITDF